MELLKDVEGVIVHDNPNADFDSNFWLTTIVLDEHLHIKGQSQAYAETVEGAVGGAAGYVHAADNAHTDSEPNANVEALRLALDKEGIEARPLWKPMHLQPVFANSPAYVNGVSEALFHRGLCLPSGPCVSENDVQRIVEVIKESIDK